MLRKNITVPLSIGCLVVFNLLVLLTSCSRCGGKGSPDVLQDAVPAKSLTQIFPAASTWSHELLAQARDYAEQIGTGALVVIHAGEVVAEWGSTAKEINSHSVRKSLLSALFGIAVTRGMIDINRTLLDIGIDDKSPPLSATERSATVRDLLMSRSGIYHKAAYESSTATSKRPARGAHDPGSFWYYNNWDFNALATIFEQQTGLTIGDAFAAWIAKPIGMQDFSAKDVDYVYQDVSQHPAYPFWITARDLARFGMLYLNNGIWEGSEILSSAWISESMTPYSLTDIGVDEDIYYGYMWWILENGVYEARGTGQQVLHIDTINQVVIVHRSDTCRVAEANYPSRMEINELFDRIIAAHPDHQS